MIGIRFHARGGHGVKTAGRILGTAAFLEGLEVQDAPLYGAERRGAAVTAFARIGAEPILERGAIHRPDLIVVGDETLMADAGAGVLAGAESASAVFVNTPKPKAPKPKEPEHESLEQRYDPDVRWIGFDVTLLTLEALGRASALSAGLGAAAARLCGLIGEHALEDAVREELADLSLPGGIVEANVAVALEIFESLPAIELGTTAVALTQPLHAVVGEGSVRRVPSILAPGNAELRHTGSWRVERPEIDYESCTRCALCFVRCPDGAIAIDAKGYPVIDYDHCKGCMICRTTCPLDAVGREKEIQAW